MSGAARCHDALRRRRGARSSRSQSIGLSVGEHEFVSIVGPSGCGKSTLLYLVGGFIRPTTGEIRLRDRPVTGPGPDRGIVFQRYSLFPWLKVCDNIAYGLVEQGMPRADRERIVDEHVRLVHLEGFENRYPRELSGGMQQRVAHRADARLQARHPADGRAVRCARCADAAHPAGRIAAHLAAPRQDRAVRHARRRGGGRARHANRRDGVRAPGGSRRC